MTTSTRPRKAATRKSTARQPTDRLSKGSVSTLVDGGVEPLNLDAEPQEQDEASVHLFTLHEVEYFVPAEPRANLALQFMSRYRVDSVAAQGWLLEQMLGIEAYDALALWDGLKPRHLEQLVAAVTTLTMGSVEDATRPLGRG